jgi:hypothetical protein
MVRRLLVLLALGAVFGIGVAACSNEGSPAVPTNKSSTTTSTSDASSTPNTAASGSSTTGSPTSTTTPSGPGIPMTGPSGSGKLTWSVDASRVQFCYQITITGAGDATAAHLRRVDGNDEVLKLVAPGVNGTVNTCSPSDQITVQQLQSTPSSFYVDVVASKGTLKATLK